MSSCRVIRVGCLLATMTSLGCRAHVESSSGARDLGTRCATESYDRQGRCFAGDPPWITAFQAVSLDCPIPVGSPPIGSTQVAVSDGRGACAKAGPNDIGLALYPPVTPREMAGLARERGAVALTERVSGGGTTEFASFEDAASVMNAVGEALAPGRAPMVGLVMADAAGAIAGAIPGVGVAAKMAFLRAAWTPGGEAMVDSASREDPNIRAFLEKKMWFDEHLYAESDADRVVMLEAILRLAEDLRTGFPGTMSDPTRQSRILGALRRVAGSDGFLNLGDEALIIPTVSDVCWELAREGLADGSLPELRDPRVWDAYQVAYRGKASLFKHTISKKFWEGFNSGVARKAHEASLMAQTRFHDMLAPFGVRRTFLGVHSDAPHIDTAAPLSSAEFREFFQLLTGRDVSELRDARSLPSNPEFERLLGFLSSRVSSPDGIPVAEGIRMMEQVTRKEVVSLPETLMFGFDSQGSDRRLEMRAYRPWCDCYHSIERNRCVVEYSSIKPNGVVEPANRITFVGPESDAEQRCSRAVCDGMVSARRPGGIMLANVCGGRYLHHITFRQEGIVPGKKDDSGVPVVYYWPRQR